MENRILISDLCNISATYLDGESVAKIYEAYLLAADAHDGQYRKSGEAYVFHPLAVALILAKLKLDYQSIIAAMLHDVIEDTPITAKDIEAHFGSSVAHIVEGVSKIDSIEHKNVNIKQAQNFRKLLIAASTDARVLIIKLADRLHNMRTISAMNPASQKRIAKETQEIYIPISRRMGLEMITSELKLLTFKTIHPIRYGILERKLIQRQIKTSGVLESSLATIRSKLSEHQVNCSIAGREKDIVSIYNKMKVKKLRFNEIFDLYGLRIIVDELRDCYHALGVVHNAYKPIPGKFKDYIAIPKNNGYQSLHTVIFAENRQMIEVQIRTTEMDNIANYGIASHWFYKNRGNAEIVPSWLQNIRFDTDDDDFIESAQAEILQNDVFVFTPVGDIIKLSHQATALDLAYHIHTDIGNYAISCVIDNMRKPLSTALKSGQTVEIITDKKPHVTLENLDIVQSPKAKYEIKNFLKRNFSHRLIKEGKQLLTDVLFYQGIDMDYINLVQHLEGFGVSSVKELFIKITLKEILLSKVVSTINQNEINEIIDTSIDRSQKVTPELATCCYPVPGDNVVGVINQNRGFVIHRKNCGHIVKNKNIYKVDWHFNTDEVYKSKISCNVTNERGAFASIATTVANLGFNIIDIDLIERHNNTYLEFIIEVGSKTELQATIAELETLSLIKSIIRV